MKIYFLAVLAFVIGLVGVFGYYRIRTRPVSISITPAVSTIPTPLPSFALVPPSQAVSGAVTVVTGHAQKLSREEAEYKEASAGAILLAGESMATKEHSSATISVDRFVTMNLGAASELVFANPFPENFVIQQKMGRIDYAVFSPISIRALHALITINSGETIINIIDTDLSITVKTGTVKFALVDMDNTTNVWDLKAGERANVDDAARRVYLVRAH